MGGAAGLALAGAARGAFVTALNNGAVAAVCVVVVGGLMVLRFMPPRHLPIESTER